MQPQIPTNPPMLVEGQPKKRGMILDWPVSTLLFYSAAVALGVDIILWIFEESSRPWSNHPRHVSIQAEVGYTILALLTVLLLLYVPVSLVFAFRYRKIENIQEKEERRAEAEWQADLAVKTEQGKRDTPPTQAELDRRRIRLDELKAESEAKLKQAELESKKAIEDAKITGEYSLAVLKLQAQRDLYEIDKQYQDEETQRKIDAMMKQMDANIVFFRQMEELKKTDPDLAQFMYNQWTAKEK